jgi:hypothetical protein
VAYKDLLPSIDLQATLEDIARNPADTLLTDPVWSLLTKLTAPLLQETSMQAQFLIPVAVSLAYGILFATVITLLLIPALLCIQLDVQVVLRRLRSTVSGASPAPQATALCRSDTSQEP